MTSFRSVTPRALFPLALVFLAAACSEGKPGGSRTATVVTSEEVGASGANLTGPEGSSVVVPADALAGNVTIVVSALDGVRTPTGTAVVGTAIRLEPAGTTFDKPVEVTIPISATALGGSSLDDVVIIRSEQNSDVFVPLPTRRSSNGNAVVAVTEHFSDFVPVLVMAGMSPFGACGDAMCMSGETCDSCPTDCGVCVGANICGNGTCESDPMASAPESCSTCEFDCGVCATETCGDGIIDAKETCDTAFVGGTSLELCGCDDGDPCTTDAQIMGSTGFCNVVCTHTPLTGYGISTCDDALGCTSDSILSMDAAACTMTCSNTLLDNATWGTIYCDDGDACTNDYLSDFDPLTCDSTTCMHEGSPTCGLNCGDGIRAGAEACDDANTAGGDGCSADCSMIELGYSCLGQGGVCWICGDSIVTAGEACDDGNAVDGDGCENACTFVPPGYTCQTPGTLCTLINLCGNGAFDGVEECDDGDTLSGDGCDASCTIEAGFMCPMFGFPCFMATCGDGMVEGFEACDDGNTVAEDGCADTCLAIEYGYGCPTPGTLCFTTCGDSEAAGAEQCDDGDFASGNGCSSICTVEAGFTCPPAGGACTPDMVDICGDGAQTGFEECDDFGTADFDGCSSTCTVEFGWMCAAGSCNTICGDNVTVGLEACDDGPSNGSYGFCDIACAGPGPFCGDGTVDGPEICDDASSNGMYGFCDISCAGPGPFCGDGIVNGAETCDDGPGGVCADPCE